MQGGKVMSSQLIQLQDGVFVEVEIPEAQSRQLAGSFADKVNANIDISGRKHNDKACFKAFE